MNLFDQLDFTGGLNAEYDRLKSPRNSYPLLLNGRTRNGNVQPIKKHLRDTNIPAGNYQNLLVVGDYLIAIVSGKILYKNIVTAGNWEYLSGWVDLDSSVSEIYATLIPTGTNFINVSGSPNVSELEFNPQIAQTPQGLFITDGINQPRVLYGDLTWEVLNTYEQWNVDSPQYVPVCLMPAVSGVKLYVVSADKKKIYQSVSGRYTDFVVNIATNGDKGGDADTVAYAVDFNDITALHPTQQGGLLASTLYATYLLIPTDTLLFNEPVLSIGDPAFPVGAVNWKSYVPILGDVAFIAQSGIHSMNVTMQLQRESNNNPFSRPIARYLSNPQTDTCAVAYDDYALFAVNTTYGRGVVVYDTIREQFVSLDIGFGTVRRFAVYKSGGVNRLFFITTDNELYEAYASTENQVVRLLLGDFAYFENGVRRQIKVDNLFLWFNNITSGDVLRVSYYADNALIDSAEVTVEDGALVNLPPAATPFPDQENILAVKYGVPPREAAKVSIYLEWSADMEFVGLSADGATESIINSPAQTLVTVPNTSLIVLSNPLIHTLVANHTTQTLVNDLTPNDYYYVDGSADIGSRTVTDNFFRLNIAALRLTGKLYNVNTFRTLWERARIDNEAADVLCLGNMTDGTEDGWTKINRILTPANIYGAASYKDLDATYPAWYKRRERYGIIRHTLADIFFLSGGWNSANLTLDSAGNPTGTSTEIDGYTQSSNQAQWLKYWLNTSTARYKIILVGYPIYTDEATMYPGFNPLRWPFKAWGADLVLSLSPGAYERFYQNGMQYINLGSNGSFRPNTNRAVRRTTDACYLELTPRNFSLDIRCKDISGRLVDSTTVFTR